MVWPFRKIFLPPAIVMPEPFYLDAINGLAYFALHPFSPSLQEFFGLQRQLILCRFTQEMVREEIVIASSKLKGTPCLIG
jgi:hypothetical protein